MAINDTAGSRSFNRYYKAIGPILTHPTVQAYTMVVLSLLTMAFFGYFAIKPTLTTIVTLRRQIKDARQVDQKLQEKINALSAASTQYEVIKPDLELIAAALPRETRFAPFVKALEKIATESGVSVTSLNFSAVNLSSFPATGTTKEVPIGFTLAVGGDYVKVADFLKKITFYERLVTVDKMELRGKKDEPIRFNLSGQTYFLPVQQKGI